MSTKAITDKSRLIVWIILLMTSAASTQSGGPYRLTSSSIDGGGGTCSGGPYTMSGTIGQPDADWSRGGVYEVLGGFWPGGPICTVGFDDFARFAQLWLVNDPGDPGDPGAVDSPDFSDLQYLTDYWLLPCPQDWSLK